MIFRRFIAIGISSFAVIMLIQAYYTFRFWDLSEGTLGQLVWDIGPSTALALFSLYYSYQLAFVTKVKREKTDTLDEDQLDQD